MPKKMKKKGKPELHKDLDGLEIKINEFGETVNLDIDKLNAFLNEKVDDKKLRDAKSTDSEEE